MYDKSLDSNSSMRTDLDGDTLESDPKSPKHQKSSTAQKPGQRKQMQSNKHNSGRVEEKKAYKPNEMRTSKT